MFRFIRVMFGDLSIIEVAAAFILAGYLSDIIVNVALAWRAKK